MHPKPIPMYIYTDNIEFSLIKWNIFTLHAREIYMLYIYIYELYSL